MNETVNTVMLGTNLLLTGANLAILMLIARTANKTIKKVEKTAGKINKAVDQVKGTFEAAERIIEDVAPLMGAFGSVGRIFGNMNALNEGVKDEE